MTGTAVDRPVVNSIVRPVVTPAAMVEAHKEVAELIAKALDPTKDYGVIPGTGNKPTLLKPGAERLVKAFGCVARYHIVETERDHNYPVVWTKRKKVWDRQVRGKFSLAEEHGTAEGLYRYVVRAEIVTLDTSMIVGDGLGSCSTMESKYVDRPRDSENTVLKMAQKRALVAAVLNAFGLSDRFTQDVEDLGGHEEQDPSGQPEVPAEPEPPTPRTEKQDAYFNKLNKSSVWTDEERGENATKVSKMDAAQMKEFLDQYVAEFNRRKLTEKEGKKVTAGDAAE